MDGHLKLSICIPTYNRPRLVEQRILHIQNDLKLPFSYEIVISDNSPGDETAEVVRSFQANGERITYVKQDSTVPAYHNQCSVLRRAAGEYALFLCDDDFIIRSSLLSAIGVMDEQPGILAAFTPHEVYDGLLDQVLFTDFKAEQDQIFSKDQFLPMFSFFVSSGLRPELGLYRTSALGSMMTPRVYNAPSYANLAFLVQAGAVLIPAKPFYRFVIRSPLNPNQSHEGINWARKLWNQEIGGIEELFFLISQTTGTRLDDVSKATLARLLDMAEMVRLTSAMGLCKQQNDYLQAYELFVRIKGLMMRHAIPMASEPRMQEVAGFLLGRLETDVILQSLQAMTDVKDIVLYKLDKSNALMPLLLERGADKKYNIHAIDSEEQVTNFNSVITLFVGNKDSDVEELRNMGVRPGMVVSIEALLRRYSMSAALND